ncbi:hypothetical protein Emed_007098 [Eimeria media]
MRKAAPAVALLAATAVALTAHAPSAVQAASILAEYPADKLVRDIARVESMKEADLEKQLRQVYSPSMPAEQKKIYPRNSIDVMKKMLDRKEKITDGKKGDVDFVMKRYALLLGRMLDSIAEYEKFGREMKKLTPKEFQRKEVALESMASICTSSNVQLIGYLRHAVEDLRKKWGKSADEKRQRDVLEYINNLAKVYEAHLALFEVNVEIEKQQYPNKPKQEANKDLENRHSAAEAEYARNAMQAEASAASSITDGMILRDYLSLLP